MGLPSALVVAELEPVACLRGTPLLLSLEHGKIVPHIYFSSIRAALLFRKTGSWTMIQIGTALVQAVPTKCWVAQCGLATAGPVG